MHILRGNFLKAVENEVFDRGRKSIYFWGVVKFAFLSNYSPVIPNFLYIGSFMNSHGLLVEHTERSGHHEQ